MKNYCLLCIILLCANVKAVNIARLTRISDRDGLSHNTVRCIMQDSMGYMWFGTVNGLNRYNGRGFSVILPTQGNFTLLSDNRIRSIVEDFDNYIWIRTITDIYSCYDARREQFVDYAPANSLKEFSRILLTSNGDVWLWGKNNGCCRVRHTANGLVSRLLSENEFGSKTINSVYEDSLRRIWIMTQNGLYRVDDNDIIKISDSKPNYIHEYGGHLFAVDISARAVGIFSLKDNNIAEYIDFPDGELSSYDITSVSDSLIFVANKNNMIVFNAASRRFVPSEPFFCGEAVCNAVIYTDNTNHRWFFNRSGHIWGQTDGAKFTKIHLIPENILATIDNERYEVLRDSHGIIWISTYGNGLFAIENANRITHFTKSNSNLSTNYLLSICEDKSGEIWIGTEFSGVCKLSLTNIPFRIVKPAPAAASELENAVRLIFKDSQNRFWFGTRDGTLHLVDSCFKKITAIKINKGQPYCMTEDARHNIWLGTRGGGIYVFAANNLTARSYRLENEAFMNSNYIFGLLADAKNRLWAASFGGGLFVADLTEATVAFRCIINRNMTQNRLRSVVQDKTGLIWVCSSAGIVVFDPDSLMLDNTKYTTFVADINDHRSLNNNEIKSIFEDAHGRLWFGSSGGGLNLLVREKPLGKSWFKHFSAENGISNVIIQAINEDVDGNIWVSTEGGTGISKLNINTERFENYDLANGVSNGLFNETACWKHANGELLFGASSGVYCFQPSEIRYNSYTPPVMLTSLKIDGADVIPASEDSPLKKSISITDTIRLKHNQNSFNIEFAMLNFHSPDYNQYTYYLEGYEKSWNPVSYYNMAAYRRLASGEYVFRVKGSNSCGVWNEKETTLRIIIAPPLWKTAWAYLLYFATLCAAAYCAFRLIMRFNNLRNDIKVEKRLTDYKLRFFTNISHEFRTPLTIIKGSIDNLKQQENLPADISKQIEQLSKGSSRLMRMIDQLLLFRKLSSDKLELHAQRIEAVGFFHALYHDFEELARRKNIDFRFKSNRERHEMLLDASVFDKIAHNYLSNALKHTPENGIILMRLDFSDVADRLTMSVHDSGEGVPEDMRNSLFVRFAQLDSSVGGTGVGLHLTAELAAVHKGKAEYTDSGILGGACFSVAIPLSEKNYSETQNIPCKTTDESVAIVANDCDKPFPVGEYRNCKILIVEDDDEVRDFVVAQLEKSFTLLTARDGDEGLAKATAEQPDVVVCDVMMPLMNGFEMTRRLKDNFNTSHIPIILLTAYASEEHQLEGIAAGADSYITKPFNPIYMLTRIIKLLEQRDRLRRKFAEEPGEPFINLHLVDRDKDFLEKIHKIIDGNIQNANFSIDIFAQKMNMSRTLFFQKVKGLTGYSPNEYINIIRLKRAAEMLLVPDCRISEISYAVGISNPLYFSRLFSRQFGMSPTCYRKEKESR